jgi:hypothetical protein
MYAPKACVKEIRVLNNRGYADELAVAIGIARARRWGADVINLSLGGYTQDGEPPPAIAEEIARLPAGTAVVAAAGNNRKQTPFYPAAIPRVLAVGAMRVDPDGKWARAPFSNYGPWVDACAPGVRLTSTYTSLAPAAWPGPWALWNGTSFSTAVATATITRLYAVHHELTPRQVAQLLTDPSRPGIPSCGRIITGHE